MYKILRRISSSFFPRPDRPWGEDATSTAPQIGRKRRLSSTEPDADTPSSIAKKRRGESADVSEDASQREESPVRPGKETEEVKEVTKGVREVELETESAPVLLATTDAAAVPLPDSPTLVATQDAKDVEGLPGSGWLEASAAEEQVSGEKVDTEGEAKPQSPESATNEAVQEGQEADAEHDEEEEDIPGLTAGAKNTSADVKAADVTDAPEIVDNTQATTTNEAIIAAP